MKKIVGVFFLAAVALVMMSYSSSSKGGNSGISFSKVSFEKAKKEATRSGKLVFIDAYTDWCGPCKRMAATSFKDEEVGEVFNENFVNLKVEMEKTTDGKELSRLYRVRAYPTLLIVDGEGNLVKQLVGFQTKERLIAFAESAL